MIKKQVIYKRGSNPLYPQTLGTKIKPNLRVSVGLARDVYGTGPKRKLRKVGRVLGDINSFLKKSKLISSVGAPLISTLPPNYQIPAQALLGLAQKAGYGKKRPKKVVGMGRKKDGKPSNLRMVKDGLKSVNQFLKRTQILSKTGKILNKEVPAEYRIYTDPALQIVKNLGYGKRKAPRKVHPKIAGMGMLRNQLGGMAPYRFNGVR